MNAAGLNVDDKMDAIDQTPSTVVALNEDRSGDVNVAAIDFDDYYEKWQSMGATIPINSAVNVPASFRNLDKQTGLTSAEKFVNGAVSSPAHSSRMASMKARQRDLMLVVVHD